MDFAVLVKVVPSLEEVRYDPVRRTMVREGVELYANPFDQRALTVAFQLRRPGESVSVLSMGPPSAEAPLREALALGADRVVLVSDPALSGSDTFVTARVLAGAVRRLGATLVLAGRWTTDSETGQVPPELAALLDHPVVTDARSIERSRTDEALEVTADTDTGWARYRLRPPAVVSVGEKIAKPRHPSDEEVARARDRPIETWGLREVGVGRESAGLEGSPTIVRALTNEEPHRSPHLLAEGSVADRVARALELLRPLVDRSTDRVVSFPSLSDPVSDDRELFVLVTNDDGRLDAEMLPFVAEVRRIAPALWPSAVWIGAEPAPADEKILAASGTVRGYRVRSPYRWTAPAAAARAFAEVLAVRPRGAAAASRSDAFGRSVAGQLAATRGLGLTGDAVGLRVNADGTIVWSKPAFGGGLVAGVTSRTRPSLATVRPGVFRPADRPSSDRIVWTEVPFSAPASRVERLGTGTEVDVGPGTLAAAPVVIAAGTGVGGPDGIAELRRLMRPLTNALVATRRVVDAGWVPRQLQVGLTGLSLAPAVAILVGVSGSANHLVGWRRARALVAINSLASAPVFEKVDVGLVGRWQEIVPALVAALRPLFGRGSDQ